MPAAMPLTLTTMLYSALLPRLPATLDIAIDIDAYAAISPSPFVSPSCRLLSIAY